MIKFAGKHLVIRIDGSPISSELVGHATFVNDGLSYYMNVGKILSAWIPDHAMAKLDPQAKRYVKSSFDEMMGGWQLVAENHNQVTGINVGNLSIDVEEYIHELKEEDKVIA